MIDIVNLGSAPYIEDMIRRTVEVEFDNAVEKGKPHSILKPKLSLDGNQWCCLYGDNLQVGLAGFGDSPKEAFENFDKNYQQRIEGGKDV